MTLIDGGGRGGGTEKAERAVENTHGFISAFQFNNERPWSLVELRSFISCNMDTWR